MTEPTYRQLKLLREYKLSQEKIANLFLVSRFKVREWLEQYDIK